MIAIDAGTGQVQWKADVPSEILHFSSPTVGADGTIYFGTADGYLHALNPDGTEKWKSSGGGIAPSIGNDGTIYSGAGTYITAFNSDGTLKWQYNTNSSNQHINVQAAIDKNGVLYTGNERGTIYAINPDGTLRWWKGLDGGPVLNTPMIGADGKLYVGTQGGGSSNLPYGVFYALSTKPDPYLGQCVFQSGSYQVDDWDEVAESGSNNEEFNVTWNNDLIFYFLTISNKDSHYRPYWEAGSFRYTRGSLVYYDDEWSVHVYKVCKTPAGTEAP